MKIISIAAVLIALGLTGCSDIHVSKANRDQWVINDSEGFEPQRGVKRTCATEQRSILRVDKIAFDDYDGKVDTLLVTCR